MFKTVAMLVLGYLSGALPFPYLVTRWVAGKDIRYAGNGNMGARNAVRLVGLRWGYLVLALELGKGALAYGLTVWLSAGPWLMRLAGVAMLLGHWFPLWLAWRGGIGAAAVTGFLAARWPIQLLVALPTYLLARQWLPFKAAYAIGALVLIALLIWQASAPGDAAYAVLLWVSAGLKKVADLPRQREMLQRQGPC